MISKTISVRSSQLSVHRVSVKLVLRMVRKILHEENSRTALFGSIQDPPKAKTGPQYIASILATLSALSLGQCLSWTSSAIPMLKSKESHIPITDEEGSWIGSLLTIGACFGAIPAGAICFRIGPKTTLQLLALPILASWFLIAFGTSIWFLYMARLLAGLAVGATCVAAPAYVAELAETKIRGTLGTFFQLQITVGLLLEFILGALIYDFQAFNLVSAAIPVVFLSLFSFMPESPVYFVMKGNSNAAKSSLQWFRGKTYDVEDELTRIRDNVKESCSQKAKIADLVNCKASSRALIISLGLMVFQQLSGINAVLFYAKQIFAESKGTFTPDQCAIIIGLAQVFATYFSTILIDKSGRRFLLLISSSVMGLSLMLLSLFFILPSLHSMSFLPLVCIAIFIVVFSIGFGPIPWIMIGEIFPTKIKGLAGSISASTNWVLAFIVTKFFQDMLEYIGSAWTFGIFGAICIIGAVFVYFLVPETKGRDAHEIRSILAGVKEPREVESNQEITIFTTSAITRRHSTKC